MRTLLLSFLVGNILIFVIFKHSCWLLTNNFGHDFILTIVQIETKINVRG